LHILQGQRFPIAGLTTILANCYLKHEQSWNEITVMVIHKG